MTNIRDSLYEYIELNDEEKSVIDSPQLQRLRRIRQLGLSSLVYPSATHTRFQHSLGVMHLAGEFADSLNIDDVKKRELRMAGLLHDSGHGPFSHSSEIIAEKHGIEHEGLSCRVVDELKDDFDLEARRIKKMIKGELEIGQAVAGDIDADRMDYLVRDAHTSGLGHGQIDTATIIRLAEIDSRRIVFNYKAVQALESLFTSRFHMIRSLYKHHTSDIAEKMLERALEDLLKQGYSIEEMMKMDDYRAHTALLDSEGISRQLYSDIKNRDLYKRALVWDLDDLPGEGLRSLERRIKKPRKVEEKIADEAGVSPENVIIHRPNTPGINDIEVKIKKDGEIKNLSEISPVPETLTKAEWRTVAMKVYSPEDVTDEVNKAAEKVLKDYANVLGSYT